MSDSTLIGRETELALLDDALAQASERGGALLISGAAGIGKTSLLRATSTGARNRGYKVLAVTGVESEADLPYAGLHQLLQPVLNSAGSLPTPQRAALMTALGMRAGAPPEAFMVALAALNLIDDVAADEPVVLVADDVQWLDGPTSSVLAFVARRLEATHVLLVAGLREGFDTPLRSAEVSEIRVDPLSPTASTELLGSVAPDLEQDMRRLVLSEASGNPLALLELPRALRQQGADSREGALRSLPLTDRLERAFSAQAQRLPKPTQSALLLIALDNDPTVSDVLGAARLQAGDEVQVDVLQPALDAGLISVTGSAVRFRHPLIRSALEQAAGAGQRRAAHLAMATVIADPDRRAWHRAKSVVGKDERAAADLEAVARRAQDRGATATAVGALELSASLTPEDPVRARRYLAAAELAFQLGEPGAVARLLDAAASSELTPHDLARMTWLREIFHDGAAGDQVAVADLVGVARDASADGDQNLALNLLQAAALRCWWADAGATSRKLVVDTAEDIGGVDPDPRVWEILALAAPVDAGARVSEGVAAAAIADKKDALRIQLLGLAAHAAGDFGQALELLTRAAPRLRAEGRLGLLAQDLICLSWEEVHLGRLRDAARDAEEGHRLALETQQPNWIAGSGMALGLLAGVRGDEAFAERLVSQALSRVVQLRLTNLAALGQLARGLTAMTTGRHSDAYEHLARMFDPDDEAFNELQSFAAVGYVVASAVQAGRRDEAARLMVTLEALGRRTPAALLHMGLRYARALLADDVHAERLWEIALKAEPKWPFDYAQLQMSYGAWLRRQRRITESRPHLRAARDTFEALGVPTWADKASAELRASGERMAEPSRTPRQPLSPQELQIAQMAASGLSNREIADRLFLSHRTVGAHLYRVFPKLGIASRSELPQALAVMEPTTVRRGREPVSTLPH
jgi:DNA-binding CsgD family transcriptional regulator/tetratricopeptide (TPR) repeat protein